MLAYGSTRADPQDYLRVYSLVLGSEAAADASAKNSCFTALYPAGVDGVELLPLLLLLLMLLVPPLLMLLPPPLD